MLIQRHGKRVEPMNIADKIFERFGGNHILDSQRDDDHAFVHGALDFLANLRRFVGLGRKHQDHYTSIVDRMNDIPGPFRAGDNVTRRYPATHLALFELCADRVRCRFIVMGMADEYVMSHGQMV